MSLFPPFHLRAPVLWKNSAPCHNIYYTATGWLRTFTLFHCGPCCTCSTPQHGYNISTLCSFARTYIRFRMVCNRLTHFLTFALPGDQCPLLPVVQCVIHSYAPLLTMLMFTDHRRNSFTSSCLSFSIFSLKGYTLTVGNLFRAHYKHNVYQTVRLHVLAADELYISVPDVTSRTKVSSV